MIHVWIFDRFNPSLIQPATDMKLAQALENASAQQELNKSLLRLTYVLQQRVCYSIPSQFDAEYSQHACSRPAFAISHRFTIVTPRIVGKFTQCTPGKLWCHP